MFLFLKKSENAFRVLLVLYFVYLLWSRTMHLGADSPAFWLNVEEKAGAYNARNMVLFGDWKSGGVNYDAAISSPLPALISCVSFFLLGVSLFSLRIPYALLSVLAVFFLYKVLKKEMDRRMAFLGTVIFGSVYFMFLINRTALMENLFILLTAISLFFFQDYEKHEKDASLFLFGLFSALNVAVKYSGVYFLIVSALGVLILIFGKRRSFFSGLHSFGLYSGGVALSLILPVFALYCGKGSGEFQTVKFLCGLQMGGARELFLDNLNFQYPLFFMMYIPFISLAALAGLFSMVFLRFKKLTKTDIFILLWWLLGSAVAFSARISYKRLIFLMIPVVYIAIKGSYGMWVYLGEQKTTCDLPGSDANSDRRLRIIPLSWSVSIAFAFSLLISWVAQYVLNEHLMISYSTMPLKAFFKISRADAELISSAISLVLIGAPMVGVLTTFRKVGNVHEAIRSSKRCFVAALLVFSIIALALSIITNEDRIVRWLLHPQTLKYESSSISRELDEAVKANTTIIGSEMAFRLCGFQSHCKFIFNHDSGDGSGRDYHELDYDGIIRRTDIRYFCVVLPTNSIDFDGYMKAIKKIESIYPAMAHIKIFRFDETFFFLFDKYPVRKS